MNDSPSCRDLKEERQDLRDRLIAFLKEQDIKIEDIDTREDASLIRSGLLDSLALFQLSLWVEREAGRPYDLTAVDLSREWDTVSGIVGFVEALKEQRLRSSNETVRPGPPGPAWDTKS
jgi:acyl carrier protein